jgi:nitroimidazol reductase NimA-like FMN-containing flavoprotein (pyridoxamine 5'-phosphate oxidase superfamily)
MTSLTVHEPSGSRARLGRSTGQRDDTGFEVLDRGECVSFLSKATVGRVAVTIGALPVVLPVNFSVIGEEIVFLTGEGTKLTAALRGTVVAFEVDWADELSREAWSVHAVGVSRVMEAEAADWAAVERAGLRPWAPMANPHIVKIEPTKLSGRRYPPRAALNI